VSDPLPYVRIGDEKTRNGVEVTVLEANVGGLFALKQIIDEHIRRRSKLKQDGHDPAKMPVRYATPIVSRGARGARTFELVLDNDGDFPKEEEARVVDQEKLTAEDGVVKANAVTTGRTDCSSENEANKPKTLVPFASLPIGGQREEMHRKVDNWFMHHPPKNDQEARYQKLRCKFRALAHDIVDMTPPCADQTVALRKLQAANMAVNVTIACNE